MTSIHLLSVIGLVDFHQEYSEEGLPEKFNAVAISFARYSTLPAVPHCPQFSLHQCAHLSAGILRVYAHLQQLTDFR